jgi:N-methylhydantoinase B/oxoprolinase/acetone carboxylase alpha subunit
MSPKTETRKHRTPEQVVADLEAKIAAVKQRAASKEAKANPVGKALLLAVKAIDKAQAVAAEAKNEPLGRALEASRAPLSEQVVAMGIRLPDPKAKKGGRRKKAEAA